ncbi:MAG: 6-phosphofructokinase [Phycisphaerales bacterium]|nr:6-phosphofructokinase [Phycisphaerales bacterium]
MGIKRIGIIVGGGPAPGINAVIGAATIEALNRGIDVLGFYEGFRWLSSDAFDPDLHTTALRISDVARIHWDGGSILRTARTSLLDKARLREHTMASPDAERVRRVLANLRLTGIDALITIGGDDTALSARFVCDSSEREIRLAHVPKTIDNDLPLPHDVPTFGFSTARFLGTQLVKNLMQDSQTTGRWYLVESMGRSAGWLAQSIGMSAGATLTLIPEEFEENAKVQNILDVIEGAIIKRRVMGRPDGVAILAEGLAYKLGDADELSKLLGRPVPLDAAGHPRLSEVNLVNLLKNELQARFAARGQTLEVVDHELGYELRCADPTPYDMAYCRSLGYFAVELLRTADQPPAAMVSVVNGNLTPIDLHDMIDPKTNRTRVRMVDLKSDSYRIARAYMIRLEPADLDDPERLRALAKEANMAPDEFERKFRRAATRRDL